MNLLTVPLATLRKVVELREQRDALLNELAALTGAPKVGTRRWKPRTPRTPKEANATPESD